MIQLELFTFHSISRCSAEFFDGLCESNIFVGIVVEFIGELINIYPVQIINVTASTYFQSRNRIQSVGYLLN